MKVLALVTDAFGGRGGIALYVQDVLSALCAHPEVEQVVAVPRLVVEEPGALPEALTYCREASGSKIRYVREALRQARRMGTVDLVVSCHLGLLPLAAAIAKRRKAPLLQFLYGIEAWRRSSGVLTRRSLRRVGAFASISQITLDRFVGWSGLGDTPAWILPNAIRTEKYQPGPKPPHLVDRYGLRGKRVLLTLGRMASGERYKGFDEILEALSGLAGEVPDLAYLAAGDGDDRERLERKARMLGVASQVVFPGYVAASEIPEHYRLGDAFVMPGRGEGFGFVYLEALASGIPCLGSTLDGSREALRGGMLGTLVDPRDAEQVREGIRAVLDAPRGVVPEGLGYFSYLRFERRLHDLLGEWLTLPTEAVPSC